MESLNAFELDDLKLIYTTLQAQLLEVEELIDSPFLAQVQEYLRAHAADAGVDSRDHGLWVDWLAARKVATSRARLKLVQD